MKTYRLTVSTGTTLGARQTISMNVAANSALVALAEAEITLRNLFKKSAMFIITGCEEI